MSRIPKTAMKMRKQQREQGVQSDASHSAGSAISKSTDIRKLVFKLTRRFDSFSRHLKEVHYRLDFLKDKLKLLEDRFTYLDPKRPYVEKYGDIEVDESLLRTEEAQNRWMAFVEMPQEGISRTFHKAFGAGYFKWILFMQDWRHWDVPKKENKLWNWLKNQRVSMREYESGERENKYTAHPRYYGILKYDI
jgi:hypothetical protein